MKDAVKGILEDENISPEEAKEKIFNLGIELKDLKEIMDELRQEEVNKRLVRLFKKVQTDAKKLDISEQELLTNLKKTLIKRVMLCKAVKVFNYVAVAIIAYRAFISGYSSNVTKIIDIATLILCGYNHYCIGKKSKFIYRFFDDVKYIIDNILTVEELANKEKSN